MTVNSLERIMGEFPDVLDAVKSLCLKIKKILFPLDKDERMTFSTPEGEPARVDYLSEAYIFAGLRLSTNATHHA